MKIIFLDIDGVLNYRGCKSKSPSGCYGIEQDKVKLLKNIVEQTNAKLVLTSTWKTDWYKTNRLLRPRGRKRLNLIKGAENNE